MVLDVIVGFLSWLTTTITFLIQTYGLIGLFIAAILSSATIVLGVPIEIGILLMLSITHMNPFIVGVVAGIGAAIGEMTGYFLGRGSIEAFEKLKHEQVQVIHRLKEQINSKGVAVILFFTVIPLIPFDVIGIAAGLVEMNPIKFFITAAIGKSIRFTIIGFAAVYGVQAILSLFGLP